MGTYLRETLGLLAKASLLQARIALERQLCRQDEAAHLREFQRLTAGR